MFALPPWFMIVFLFIPFTKFGPKKSMFWGDLHCLIILGAMIGTYQILRRYRSRKFALSIAILFVYPLTTLAGNLILFLTYDPPG